MRSFRVFMRITRLVALALGLVGALSLGASAHAAGISAGIPAFTGNQFFNNSSGAFTVSANVNFTVFAPGVFDTVFPGQDPSGGADYVYAYQIENLDTDVLTLTVGLDGDESLGSISFITGVGFVNPTASQFIGASPTSAVWDFGPGQLTTGLFSAILFFTSADAPEPASATVLAAFADTQNLPSPVPEPASLSLVALSACFLLQGKRRRV